MSILQAINSTSLIPNEYDGIIPLSHTRNNNDQLSTFAQLNKQKCSCYGCHQVPRGDSPASTSSSTTTTTTTTTNNHVSISLFPPRPPHVSVAIEDDEVEYQEPSLADRIQELKQKAIDALIVLKMALLDKQDDIYTSPSYSTTRLNILNMRHENLDREIIKVRKTIKAIQTISADEHDYV